MAAKVESDDNSVVRNEAFLEVEVQSLTARVKELEYDCANLVQNCLNTILNCKNESKSLHLGNRLGRRVIVHKNDITQIGPTNSLGMVSIECDAVLHL